MAFVTKTVHQWDTEYSADSAEFCPLDPYLDYLAVGTYQLADEESNSKDEELSIDDTNAESNELTAGLVTEAPPKQRLGRLYLHRIVTDKTELVEQINMPAILDMKWSRHRVFGKIVLAIVNASGEMLLYYLNEEVEQLKLKYWCKYTLEGDKTLALSLDWSNTVHNCPTPSIIISDSMGMITVLSVGNGSLEQQKSFAAHNFEAWIAAFNYWDTNLVYSGGDDCKFRGFDIRSDSAIPTFTSKVHDAGVTSLQTNMFRENQLVSGSYDEKVRVWDCRSMRQPLKCASVGGGVWRLKWDPWDTQLLLVAAMYNGYHILDANHSDINEIPVVMSFMEHKSILYGVDWSYCKKENQVTIASASFYDHLLCISQFQKT